jgi:hypothetical protein
MILSTFGVKQMIVAVRGPGELAWPSPAVTTALMHARIFVPLDAASGPHDLWWISVHGIYRPCQRGPNPCG